MSNLLKGNSFVVKDGGKIVIDSNKVIDQLLASRAVEPAHKDRTPDADGFVQGIDAALVEQLVADEPEDTFSPEDSANASAVIEDARSEADSILAEAREKAQAILEEARQQGYEEGYREATGKAQEDIDKSRRQLEADYKARKEQLEQETEEYRQELEPKLVDTLMTVFSQVTKAFGEEKKDMIYFLVDNVLRNTEMSHEFIIRCSEEDYKFLIASKQKLYGANNPDIRIEIVKDNSMERNQCVIETDSGVFDCSLDIQLENLCESIHLLSCLQE